MASDFMERRLRQLKPIGARMGTRAYGLNLKISTIRFGDGRWTRVEDEDRGVIRHYPGDLLNEEAAKLYLEEIEEELAA